MPKCYQSIVIAAPIELVWETVKNFHDFSWAAGVIDSCEAVGNIGGTEIGAKRVLNGAFQETLLEYNETAHRVRYSIDDGPSPVSVQEVKNYIGTLQRHLCRMVFSLGIVQRRGARFLSSDLCSTVADTR